MNELEKYKNMIDNLDMTVGEKVEWIHEKWLDYDMTDETEEQLYEWLNTRKQAYGCEDENNFIWRCENCKELCENRNKNLVNM